MACYKHALSFSHAGPLLEMLAEPRGRTRPEMVVGPEMCTICKCPFVGAPRPMYEKVHRTCVTDGHDSNKQGKILNTGQ